MYTISRSTVDNLKMLDEGLLKQIDKALEHMEDSGEVRLIVREGRLTYIQYMEIRSIDE